LPIGKSENSLSDCWKKSIETILRVLKVIACWVNEGHWNNVIVEFTSLAVPIKVIGTMEGEKPPHRLFQ
jgi:hypothetical protein